MTIQTYDRGAKFTELRLYDHTAKDDDFMEVCEWRNGEGFDVTINEKVYAFTWGQYECMQALILYKE